MPGTWSIVITLRFHHVLYSVLSVIAVLQLVYYIPMFKRYLRENHEVAEVKASTGVSSKDFWVSQKAYLTRDAIIKLRENTCKIPVLNPFATPMVEFFQPVYLNCTKSGKTYFRSHVEYLDTEHSQPMIIIFEEVPKYFRCCYKQLRFSNKRYYDPIDQRTDNCNFFDQNKTAVPSDSENIIVKCWNATNHMNVKSPKVKVSSYPHHYELLFYVPKPSQELLKRKNEQISKQRSKPDELLNIIIIGYDQISRANFIRLMRNTWHHLRTELDAIDLQGFNKIGDATMNNTLALLTGYDFGAIRKNPEWWDGHEHFDKCPWIWKNFSEKGYLTGYADDQVSIFDHRYNGFLKQPTDYYFHPFVRWYFNWTMVRWRKYGNSHCIGNELVLDLLQDHARKLSAAVKHPYFHFIWSSLTAQPPAGYPANADKGTLKTLQHFQKTGVMNRSLVILVSDHGWRTGDVMLNRQARLENRLSFAFLLLPKWFREKYPLAYANLKENQYRLTTPYDIHSTLVDMLNPSVNLVDKALRKRTIPDSKGISLFTPIPKERTCKGAGIDEEWCACTSYKPFSPGSPIAKQLARYAVKIINSWIKPFPSCKQFTLHEVLGAEVKIPSGSAPLINLKNHQQFRIMFSTLPIENKAQFEVTIFTGKDYFLNEKSKNISMSNEVFRLNKYYSATCMKIYSLKPVCICNKTQFVNQIVKEHDNKK